jgi:hypothetical protein
LPQIVINVGNPNAKIHQKHPEVPVYPAKFLENSSDADVMDGFEGAD